MTKGNDIVNNPFNLEKQPHEFSIFAQLTENIDRWMVAKYPGFDISLNTKIRRLEEIQTEIEIYFHKYKNIRDEIKLKNLEYFRQQIHHFMKHDYPDMSGKLSTIAKTLQEEAKSLKSSKNEAKKTLESKIKEIDAVLTNAKMYNTLCEDVYRLRDKMERIELEVSEFTQKIKRAFE